MSNTKEVKCDKHPLRLLRITPTNNCFDCMQIFQRIQFKIRIAESKTGHKRGDPVNGKGKCGVCLRPLARLTKNKLPSGLPVCETCNDRFGEIDSKSMSRESLRSEMVEYGVPLRS